VVKKLEELAKTIDGINNQLAAWQETLRCFDSNEEALKSIKEISGRYKIELETMSNEYESGFLLRKLADYQQKVLSFGEIKLQSDHK
jgi:hypothetical protein